MSDQVALTGSSAGMRLLAQLTLFNRGDFKRLRTFIAESYTPAALEAEILPARLAAFKAAFLTSGKLRVKQVVAVDKYQSVVVLQGQHGGLNLVQIAVSEDYPHQITLYDSQKLG